MDVSPQPSRKANPQLLWDQVLQYISCEPSHGSGKACKEHLRQVFALACAGRASTGLVPELCLQVQSHTWSAEAVVYNLVGFPRVER